MRFPAFCVAVGAVLTLAGGQAGAAPASGAPVQGDWRVRDFRFHTGQVLPELNLHYTTLGDPAHEAVLVLHGTGGSGAGLLSPAFGGELFGPGQPLDAARYFIILPDAIGHGRSSKPSDGLRARFPEYNCDDMIEAQFRLVTEKLGVRHLRAVVGNSMGGMHVWMWGEAYPDFMDVLVPLAAEPAGIAGRNWMMRRMLIETVRRDPDWKGGDYTVQPRSLQYASALFGLATNGGTLAYRNAASTRESADRLVAERLDAPFNGDANDTIFQFAAARDYDPGPGLERITAAVLAVNSADDERNPVETGVMERELKRVRGAQLHLIPAGPGTRGHGTVGMARFWAGELAAFLQAAPRRAAVSP
jgi:homoserine O-acetyltransferase